MDVFGGLAGPSGEPDEPGDGLPDAGPPIAPADLEPVLDGAALWGLELDTRYRVLAATFEPRADRYPWSPTSDRRIQVLAFPVSTILASLRSTEDGRTTVHTFDEHQLVEVATALGGAVVTAPLFGSAEPRPGQWAPEFSLQGRSTAPDGTAATLRFDVEFDGLAFGLFARFDELRVRDARGQDLSLPA